MNNRTKIIGVMGSGSESHSEFSKPLGQWIAQNGFHLLTGAGAGVMKAVSEAFVQVENRKGMSIGIVPGEIKNSQYHNFPGYPNPWIEIPIFTHLPLSGIKGKFPMSRNHINILSSDLIVVLPGSSGTISEIELALKYKKPVVGFFNNFYLIEEKRLSLANFNNMADLVKFISFELSKKHHQ